MGLAVAGDWERKGSYHTAWRSHVIPHVLVHMRMDMAPLSGRTLESGAGHCQPEVWRAIAPLMQPWCAEGDLPTAANLNLYRGWKSCVGWHCDDEPLFGKCGMPSSLFQ